jgi:hypothetical protein
MAIRPIIVAWVVYIVAKRAYIMALEREETAEKAESCDGGFVKLHRGIARLGCIAKRLMSPAIPAIWEMSVIYYYNLL